MKAKTIAEVVAGEMTYKGTPAAQWGDALGIASVITNRATAYGVSPESVISAPGQFNAYGKSLPPGVGAKEIARAQKALDTVAQNGPSTSATHYARPEATKNIKGWDSFQKVDQIPGSHVFAIDPNMSPIRTATGVVQAQPNAFETLVNTAKVGAIRTVQAVASIPQAAAAMIKSGLPQSQLDAALAQTAGATAGLYAGGLNFTHPEQAAGITSSLRDALIGTSAEFGKPLDITSAHRTPAYNASIGGALRSQHIPGKAADIDMTGMSPAQRQDLMSELSQRGVTRFGTYSKHPNMMHVDFGPLQPGETKHFMFDETKAKLSEAPDYFRDFANSVIANKALPTPATAPVPTAAPRGTPPAAAYGQMAQTLGQAGVPHVGLSPAMAASMGPQQQGPPISAMERPQQGPPAPSQAAPTQARVGTGPFSVAPDPSRFEPAAAPASNASMASGMTGAVPVGPKTQAVLGPLGALTPSLLGETPVTAAATQPAIPADPRATAIQSMPLTGWTAPPSLAELPEPVTPPEHKVATVQPAETVTTTPRQIRPAPTIVPAPPAPAKPAGLIGALENLAAPLTSRLTAPFHTLANLAGPVPNPPSRNIGYGSEAISSVLGGQTKPGDIAYSKSMPGYSVRDLGNGMIEKSNQFGVKSFEHVGTPGSMFAGGQLQPGGLLAGLGVPGLGQAIGGFFGGSSRNNYGFGNTANVGPNAFGYAGPWGAGTAPVSGGGGLFGGWGGGGGSSSGRSSSSRGSSKSGGSGSGPTSKTSRAEASGYK